MLADASDPLTQLSRMSLEELGNVEVTSVSKSAQTLTSAPASIYVITQEEIHRSGVLSIPEALRLAPNLQVEQINAQEYQIVGARLRQQPGVAELLQQDPDPHRRPQRLQPAVLRRVL